MSRCGSSRIGLSLNAFNESDAELNLLLALTFRFVEGLLLLYFEAFGFL